MPRSMITLLVLVALVTGCDATPTAMNEQSVEPLDFFVPPVAPDVLADFAYDTLSAEPAPDGPDEPALIDGVPRPLQQIFSAQTRVGYDHGYAWALGSHRYIGNVASIATTAHVAYGSAHLGSQTANKQDYMPFLLDFGTVKFIWVQPKVYTDHDCGLSVQGNSDHRAWWQFYQGRSTAEWGTARRTSQAAPVAQGACAQSGTSQAHISETQPTGIVCYYLVTYDMNTMEVLRVDFLYCTGSGGVLM